MGDDTKVLNDIKSGKGLPPITTPSNSNASNGLTTENRGWESRGLRIDRFTSNEDTKQGDK